MTDGKLAEEALRRNEARYRALVNATSQAVWAYGADLEPHIGEAGPRWWEELTGQSPAEAMAPWGWLEPIHA